eukprot:g23857.t1
MVQCFMCIIKYREFKHLNKQTTDWIIAKAGTPCIHRRSFLLDFYRRSWETLLQGLGLGGGCGDGVEYSRNGKRPLTWNMSPVPYMEISAAISEVTIRSLCRHLLLGMAQQRCWSWDLLFGIDLGLAAMDSDVEVADVLGMELAVWAHGDE